MEKKPLKSLKRDPNNPNIGRAGNPAIERSIREIQFRTPGIIDVNDTIVVGNHRADAAENLGMESAHIIDVPEEISGEPIYLRFRDLDLSSPDNDARRLTFFDNHTAKISIRLDPVQLKKSIEEGVNLSPVISPSDLVRYGVRNDSSITEPKPDPFADAVERWDPKSGDVFYLPRSGEPHILVCGDSTDPDIFSHFPDDIALLLTDPPYSAGYGDKQRHLNEVTENSNRLEEDIIGDSTDVDQNRLVWLLALQNCYSKLSDTCSYYIFSSAGRQGQLRHMVNTIYEAGFGDSNTVIWNKGAQSFSRTDYKYAHEIILFGWKENGSHKFYGGFQSSVLDFNRISSNTMHPTQKPTDLLVYLMENSSVLGDTILDPFLGSGSTIMAAEHIGRRCVGIEKSPRYCAIILDRWVRNTDRQPENVYR